MTNANPYHHHHTRYSARLGDAAVIVLSPTYLSILPPFREEFGYMLNAMHGIGGQTNAALHPWMLDNGAYSEEKFNLDKWLSSLDTLSEYANSCIAVVIPDVVGNAEATCELWYHYAHIPAAHDFPVAFVTQDGLEDSQVPWDEMDCLFVGGSTQHKLSESHPFIRKAQSLGIWVHVGRVNSIKRAQMFEGCDSIDGTTLAIEPSIRNQTKWIRWMREVQARKQQAPLFTLD